MIIKWFIISGNVAILMCHLQ